MKSMHGLDFGRLRPSKIRFRSTLFIASKMRANSMTYKKRTEIAESTALEKKGRRESKMASEPAKRVNRSGAESPQMLGFFAPAVPNGERFSKDQWRRGWDSNPRYACTHNGFRDRPDRPLWHLSVHRPAQSLRPDGQGVRPCAQARPRWSAGGGN